MLKGKSDLFEGRSPKSKIFYIGDRLFWEIKYKGNEFLFPTILTRNIFLIAIT